MGHVPNPCSYPCSNARLIGRNPIPRDSSGLYATAGSNNGHIAFTSHPHLLANP